MVVFGALPMVVVPLPVALQTLAPPVITQMIRQYVGTPGGYSYIYLGSG
jgi:hypothetical protein